MRPIHTIVIHYTATPPQWCEPYPTLEAAVAEIRRWHVEGNGWRDIGYHYVVGVDGEVAIGRPVEQVGAHVGGHNTGTVGIAYIGGLDEEGRSADTRTPEQRRALRELVYELQVAHGILELRGHRDYSATDCPGFDVQSDPDFTRPDPRDFPVLDLPIPKIPWPRGGIRKLLGRWIGDG